MEAKYQVDRFFTFLVNFKFQLDYDDSKFFENVLRNLNGRTKKEMSMLGQVSWQGSANCKILMMFWFRVSTDLYGRQPPLWSMLTIAGTGIRSVRRIQFTSISHQLLSDYMYFIKEGCKVSFRFLKIYRHPHLLFILPPSPPLPLPFPKHWWYVLMIFLFCVPGWNSSTSILPQGKPSNVLELIYPQQKFS